MKNIIKYYILRITLAAVCSLLVIIDVHAEGQITVPEDVRKISEELGQAYNICPELIQAICWRESRFQSDAENGGCVGIMQVAPKWHKDRMDRLGVTDLMDTRQNMMVAVDYLSELVKDEEDMEEVLMRYHGESQINERLEAGELSAYVEGILALSAELERQNGK